MKKAMVFGAGVSGLGAQKLLIKMGYEVILVDDRIALSSKEAMKLLEGIELFIKSPGIPYTELVMEAKRKGIKIIDEIELGYEYIVNQNLKTKIIAITGTNGKTTTTTKINELLNFCGFKSYYAGNIGVSLAEILVREEKLDYIVLELSSFQLENIIEFKPFISMIINLTPDHLERYKDREEYYNTKFNICKNQRKEDFFVYNIDCEELVQREKLIPSSLVRITKENNNTCDYWIENGKIYNVNGEILECDKLSLKGRHNLENTLFIVAVAKLCNIENKEIREFLYNTKPLEHRMEIVLDYGKMRFINDSKATNIDSSRFAIEAYEKPILICGGYDKGLNWDSLINLIVKNAKEVYFIGAIAQELNKRILNTDYPKDKIHMLDTVENSLRDIKNRFSKDEENIILFSPATSSYDQFHNFEERGRAFKNLVRYIFGR